MIGEAERLFGEELKRVRTKAKLSQEELAARADLHSTYISQLERGLKSPSLRTLLRIAAALGYSAGKLVGAVERRMRKRFSKIH